MNVYQLYINHSYVIQKGKVMGRILAIANQKGGVGKTTTAINLSSCLAEMGKRILTIDLDPQGNTTSGIGLEKSELENTVYELLLDECTVKSSIYQTQVEGLCIIPSNVNLSGAEIELLGVNDKEYLLKNAIDYIRDDFDYVIIDCPPALNMLTVNAMTTANSILVPIHGLYPNGVIEGVVFTMYDARTNLSMQVVENVKENLNTMIYKTIIPRNVKLAEAPSHGLPINLYDKKSAGAESYRLLAKEIINRKDL